MNTGTLFSPRLSKPQVSKLQARKPQTHHPLFAASLFASAAFLAAGTLLTALPARAFNHQRVGSTPNTVAVATLTRTEINQLQQLQPKTAADFYDLGVMLQGTGDLEGAIRNFSRAVELEPNADHYFARGLAYADLGDHPKAIADYTIAIRQDPKFAAAYYNRGMAYMALQQLPAAVNDFSEAIKTQPEFIAAYYSRGMAYYDLGQMAQARQDYNQAMRLSPTATAAYYDRALRPQTGGPN
jgi:tetratricopeptide (TPR) repeat protein